MSSRKASKERTRSRLVQSTLKVLHRLGPAALTTGRIAESAGVAQPTFYVHFSDMDDALQQAADLVVTKLSARLEAATPSGEPLTLAEAVRLSYAKIVRGLAAEARYSELFLRHRRAAVNPLGKRWRGYFGQLRDEVAQTLRDAGASEAVGDVEVHADLLVGLALSLVEGVMDKRIGDVDAAIEVAVKMTLAGIEAGATAVSDAAE